MLHQSSVTCGVVVVELMCWSREEEQDACLVTDAVWRQRTGVKRYFHTFSWSWTRPLLPFMAGFRAHRPPLELNSRRCYGDRECVTSLTAQEGNAPMSKLYSRYGQMSRTCNYKFDAKDMFGARCFSLFWGSWIILSNKVRGNICL